uniref:Uncharacterized protein n=1 Tax=Chromera velia CCMP2878 TaxID=1169474 RepID=A0A0G4HSL2_9ALVE|eukprot:Cvel_8260.t1-p1 / transcript=Cvel_8260.t1 / gene=Cvel_8260 / organism=Chromera_velia_CCMP2878 / gene_product=hypothetical protein / transcript_product=hypothetical protein / location=Cvel_scaffold452:40009-42246(-) / protein_length=746 / sequence_SO=supercontig / SO=protein_coding / is_pseudo=false
MAATRHVLWHELAVPTSTRPSRRAGHSAVFHCEKMYVFGGMDSHGTLLNDVHVFDFSEPGQERWCPPTPNDDTPVKPAIPLEDKFNIHSTQAEREAEVKAKRRALARERAFEEGAGSLVGVPRAARRGNLGGLPPLDALGGSRRDQVLTLTPDGRVNHSAIVYGDGMFVFGGKTLSGECNELWCLDLNDINWKLLYAKPGTAFPPDPASLIQKPHAEEEEDPLAALLQGFGTSVTSPFNKSGGRPGLQRGNSQLRMSHKRPSKASILDPTLNSSERTKLPRHPCARDSCSCVLAEDRIWMFGGSASDGRCLNDVWVWDPSRTRSADWKYVPTEGPWPTARRGHVAVALTGTDWKSSTSPPCRQDKQEAEEEDSNISNSPNPQRRQSLMSNSFGKPFALAAAFKNAGPPAPPKTGLAGLSPPKNRRTSKTTATRRQSLSGSPPSASGSSVLIFGGADSKGRKLNDLWLLRLEHGQWEEVAIRDCGSSPWPLPRAYHTACLLGRSMIVFGGSMERRPDTSEVWELDTNRMEWSYRGCNDEGDPDGFAARRALPSSGRQNGSTPPKDVAVGALLTFEPNFGQARQSKFASVLEVVNPESGYTEPPPPPRYPEVLDGWQNVDLALLDSMVARALQTEGVAQVAGVFEGLEGARVLIAGERQGPGNRGRPGTAATGTVGGALASSRSRPGSPSAAAVATARAGRKQNLCQRLQQPPGSRSLHTAVVQENAIIVFGGDKRKLRLCDLFSMRC